MVKICKHCGKENKDFFKFCVYCGNEFPKYLICPNCDLKYIETDYEYCYQCGTKLVPLESYNSPINFDSKIDLLGWDDWTKLTFKFWTNFLDIAKDETNFTILNQANIVGQWGTDFSMKGIKPGIARFILNNHGVESPIRVQVNGEVFDKLMKLKPQMDVEFGEEIGVNYKHFKIEKQIHIEDEDNWDEIFQWYIENMNKLYGVFSKRILKIKGVKVNERRYTYWINIKNKLNTTNLISYSQPSDYTSEYNVSFSGLDLKYASIFFRKTAGTERPAAGFIIKSKPLFKYIKRDKKNIENELGYGLKWEENKALIRSSIPNREEFDSESANWHMETGLKLDKVISKRIKEFFND